MTFRDRDDPAPCGELPPIDSAGGDDGVYVPEDGPDDGRDGSCWGECGRDAREGKRLCDACAQGCCATCAGYGSVGGPEVIDGHACLVSRTCPDCGGGDE